MVLTHKITNCFCGVAIDYRSLENTLQNRVKAFTKSKNFQLMLMAYVVIISVFFLLNEMDIISKKRNPGVIDAITVSGIAFMSGLFFLRVESDYPLEEIAEAFTQDPVNVLREACLKFIRH